MNTPADFLDPEQTRDEYERAHARRVARPLESDDDGSIRLEREALYRHAEAVRLHAARLARNGR